ncbi:sensor histidine kinase [Spirochaeta isovalerica]|uniref:histidine kinase n=1 Tax=Spirochaeta isovalerica TaxID=150 RepID=A0A841R8X3_9SPIO|nr:sensor histidine kinase [Spirochaeta isovalerica]MBB6481744.1 two-component sensor histidine kinase [Spirochaeta isovalerica]
MQANHKRFRLDDNKVVVIHDFLYSRQKYPLIIITIALYAMIILLWGENFEVSANYFIIFPVIVVAVSFGFKGGLIAGVLGLPFNLLFFHIIHHPEYAPASLTMAEMSGIVLGSSLGYVSDFFTRMKEEMRRREKSEAALEKSLREKEILLKEINHRVKNNLNLIKSFIQLQVNRIEEGETREILLAMRNRVISIAMVQELLYAQDSIDNLDFTTYLRELSDSFLEGFGRSRMSIELLTGPAPVMLDSHQVTSLGIVTNEILTNASKYARQEEGITELVISLVYSENLLSLTFLDNGPGYPETGEGTGLGFKLIRSLIAELQGDISVSSGKDGGGELKISIPVV